MASHTLSLLSPIQLSVPQSFSDKPQRQQSPSLTLHSSSFHGNKLLITQSKFIDFALKCLRPASSTATTTTTVLSSLPTKKFPSDKIPKWSAKAIRSFVLAELEARKLKYPNTGTEALLMGILMEGTSPAAKFLRENGITFFKVREETVNVLGKSDLYFFSPEHPPLTEQAQRALDWAVEEKLKSGEDGEITTTDLLLGIWSEIESAGHKILANLGFNDAKAKELAQSMSKDSAALSYK